MPAGNGTVLFHLNYLT